jgi:hypothetical protein
MHEMHNRWKFTHALWFTVSIISPFGIFKLHLHTYIENTVGCSIVLWWKWFDTKIIHLFPLHKGDMRICSPEKSHISRGQRGGKYDYFEGEQIFISPLCIKTSYFPLNNIVFPSQQYRISLSTISYFPYSKFSRFNTLVI